MADLTDKQRRFVQEYLVDCNATRAAAAAGYSKKTANVIGCENLAKPNIRAAVQEGLKELAKRSKVDADYVVGALMREIENPESRPSDRITAASWIGRHFAMFTDKHTVEADLPPITFRVTDE